MKKFVSAVALVALALGGCAMSPQQIEVSPKITVNDAVKSAQTTISVTVYDDRPGDRIGSRGGVYSETSTISTSADFALSVRSAVELALRQMGLKVTDSQDTPQFQVYIDQLSYTVPEGYVSQVDLKATARVVVTGGGEVFSGRYSSNIQQKLVAAPSDEKNVELVNQVLSDVLGRAFNDGELKAFLNTL